MLVVEVECCLRVSMQRGRQLCPFAFVVSFAIQEQPRELVVSSLDSQRFEALLWGYCKLAKER